MKEAFIKDLQKLLEKYDAELNVIYDEWEIARIEAYIPGEDYISIGTWVDKDTFLNRLED